MIFLVCVGQGQEGGRGGGVSSPPMIIIFRSRARALPLHKDLERR